MLSPGIFIFAIFVYPAISHCIKYITFKYLKLEYNPKGNKEKNKEWTLVLSPDLWWAIIFKRKINTPVGRKLFVQTNNTVNLWFSIVFGLLTLMIASSFPMSYLGRLLLDLAILRFISRSIEITYAFVKDAFQETESATALNSKERIKLAIKSYIEIYFFSAPAYLILTKSFNAWTAMSLSLNVGTLTNVGLAFSEPSGRLEPNIVFFQVFTTLSLVIFSFAMYLARPENKHKVE